VLHECIQHCILAISDASTEGAARHAAYLSLPSWCLRFGSLKVLDITELKLLNKTVSELLKNEKNKMLNFLQLDLSFDLYEK